MKKAIKNFKFIEMTQAEFDSLGHKYRTFDIAITDSNGDPTGKLYHALDANTAHTEYVTESNINAVLQSSGGAGWEKVQATTTGHVITRPTSGASLDLHIENGGTLAALDTASWPIPTNNVDQLRIRNFSGAAQNFTVAAGAGQFTVVTADGNSATGGSYSIPDDTAVAISLDPDGFAQVVPWGGEVSQAELNAGLATKLDVFPRWTANTPILANQLIVLDFSNSVTGKWGTYDILRNTGGTRTTGATFDVDEMNAFERVHENPHLVKFITNASATDLLDGKFYIGTNVDSFTNTPATDVGGLLFNRVQAVIGYGTFRYQEFFTASGRFTRSKNGDFVGDELWVSRDQSINTLAEATTTTDIADVRNSTIRQVIDSSALNIPAEGTDKIRLLLRGADIGLEYTSISRIFVGKKATTGDAYDFAGAPVQVTVDGRPDKWLGTGDSAYTEWANLTLKSGDSIVIAMEMADGANNPVHSLTTKAGWTAYQKAASPSDGATVNATGYTTMTEAVVIVNGVEAGGDYNVTKRDLPAVVSKMQGHPYMTSASHDGYTVTHSSAFSSAYEGWNAFRESGAEWATSGLATGHITIELPREDIFTVVSLKGRLTGTEYPTEWQIQGSKDGVTFSTLLDKTGANATTLDGDFGYLVFKFTNTTAYRFYRFNMTASVGTNPGLDKIRFYGSLASDFAFQSEFSKLNVGAKVQNNAVQSITNATTTAVAFQTEDWDTNAFHDNVTNNSRLTIPVGFEGRYDIKAAVQWAANATGIRHVGYRVNGGTTTFLDTRSTASGNPTRQGFSVELNLVATDYIEVMVNQDSGGALDISNITGIPFFSIRRIGN